MQQKYIANQYTAHDFGLCTPSQEANANCQLPTLSQYLAVHVDIVLCAAPTLFEV